MYPCHHVLGRCSFLCSLHSCPRGLPPLPPGVSVCKVNNKSTHWQGRAHGPPGSDSPRLSLGASGQALQYLADSLGIFKHVHSISEFLSKFKMLLKMFWHPRENEWPSPFGCWLPAVREGEGLGFNGRCGLRGGGARGPQAAALLCGCLHDQGVAWPYCPGL